MFQCDHIHETGIPIRFNLYPPSSDSLIGDFSRIFYMLEAFCWVHHVSTNEEVRSRIGDMLKKWIDADITPRWPDNYNWFNMNRSYLNMYIGEYKDSFDDKLRFYWYAAKCAGIPSLLQYYVDNICDDPAVRERCEKGYQYLSNPLNARLLSILADDAVPDFCLQATGFGGLTVAEGVERGSTFAIFGKRK